MKISTPAFLRLSASSCVLSGSIFACPSVTRMAILTAFGRMSNRSVASRSPAAIFVWPPSYTRALTAGSSSLMVVYRSNLITSSAESLNLTTPIRTYVCEMAKRRITALTKPRTSRCHMSSSRKLMLDVWSRMKATSAICSGQAAEIIHNKQTELETLQL